MKEKELVSLRLAASADQDLSDGAFRLLDLLISDRYLDRSWSSHMDFPLPWSKAALWLGISKDQIYRRLCELRGRLYLKPGELQGCPPTRRYFLVLKGRKSAAFEGRINAAIKTRKNAAINGRESAAPHNNYSFGRVLMEKAPPSGQDGGRVETAAAPESERATGPIRPEQAVAALKSLRAELAGKGEVMGSLRSQGTKV